MLTFTLIAGGLAVLVAVAIARPLIAGRGDTDSRDARDAAVFRDQLTEIERDLARGTISADEAEGARVEVSRRLIAADQRARRGGDTHPAPQGHSGLVAGLALVGAPALAAALYVALGAPGVPDQPLAERAGASAALGGGMAAPRPGQEEAEAAMAGQQLPPTRTDPEYAAMARQLEETVAERPDDLRGHQLLADALMNLGRYAEAWRAFDRVIELSDGTVPADVRGAKAEGMILAAGGYVSPKAEAELARALELDPALAIARYYGGLAMRQSGRLNEAITMWQALRRDSPADAPYLQWLDAMLSDAVQARDGGAAGAPGAVAGAVIPGPSAEDIAAAEQLSPEERQAMVDAMVARLDDRLTRQGGTAGEWGQLVASYATLGRGDDAADAYRRAMAVLDGDGAEAVRAQAARLGVAGAEAGAAADAPATSAPPGPTQEDVAAAAQMAPDDRAAMIEGMVARLDERLTREGGTADEWGRLIVSYATLNRREAAGDALSRALAALGAGPDADAVRAQAAQLGLAAGAGGEAPAPATGGPAAPGAPGAMPGPTAQDMEAAAQMAPEDRAAMIEGMVARLETRLTGEGGDAAEWLRLVQAYMTLDRPEEAARAYALAAEALAGDPQAGFVREQALLMGVPIE